MKKQALFLFALVAIAVSSCSKSPDVVPDPSMIDIKVEKYHLHLNEDLKITNNSTGGESKWTYSDGTGYVGANPGKAFAIAGEYTVELKVGNKEKKFKVKVMDGESSFVLQSGTSTTLLNMWYQVNGDYVNFGDLVGGSTRDTIYTEVGDLSLGWVADNRRYTVDGKLPLKKFETGTYLIAPSTSFTSKPL